MRKLKILITGFFFFNLNSFLFCDFFETIFQKDFIEVKELIKNEPQHTDFYWKFMNHLMDGFVSGDVDLEYGYKILRFIVVEQQPKDDANFFLEYLLRQFFINFFAKRFNDDHIDKLKIIFPKIICFLLNHGAYNQSATLTIPPRPLCSSIYYALKMQDISFLQKLTFLYDEALLIRSMDKNLFDEQQEILKKNLSLRSQMIDRVVIDMLKLNNNSEVASKLKNLDSDFKLEVLLRLLSQRNILIWSGYVNLQLERSSIVDLFFEAFSCDDEFLQSLPILIRFIGGPRSKFLFPNSLDTGSLEGFLKKIAYEKSLKEFHRINAYYEENYYQDLVD